MRHIVARLTGHSLGLTATAAITDMNKPRTLTGAILIRSTRREGLCPHPGIQLRPLPREGLLPQVQLLQS